MRRRGAAAAAVPPLPPGVHEAGRAPTPAHAWPAHACALSLLAVRLLSAAVNTVHDCDEVFNYWEPLHFLLHGYGLQTGDTRRASSQRCCGAAHARAGC
jgi:hypothetical protein